MIDNDRKSQNLEVISNDALSQVDERRNLPRLSLTSEQFRLSRNGKIFSVTDLSQKGMGFWLLDPEDRVFFTIGLLLQGTLNLRREKHIVDVRVRNLSKDRVGCEFENLADSVSKAISDFLNPSILGAELKPIPSAQANTLWYHGPSSTDLLIRRKSDGQFDRMTLYFLGSYVHWESSSGISTGSAEASDNKTELRGILRLETLLLKADSSPDLSKLSIAKTIILSSNLSQDLKGWFVRQLER